MQQDDLMHSKDDHGQFALARDLKIRVTPTEIRLLSAQIVKQPEVTDEDLPAKTQHLPEDWVYENIKDAIYHCRRIYYIYLGILCYTLLTILTTTTLDFFREQIVSMPFIDAPISLKFYLMLAPMLLIGFFVYKQLYLYKTNKLITYAVEQCKSMNQGNGKACKDRASNCTLNCMCRRHLSRLYPWIIIYSRQVENRIGHDPEKDPLSSLVGRFQQTFVSFSLWWLLPVILLLLSLFVIKKHSIFLSTYMVAAACFGIASVAFFWHQQHKLMGRDESFLKKIRSKYMVFVTYFVAISFALNILAFQGKLPGQESVWSEEDETPPASVSNVLYQHIKSYWVKTIRYIAFADLSRETISEKPENDENEQDIWIDLEKRHFEGANLSKAILTKASLQGAYLGNAVFRDAKLEEANLDNAQADGADFNNGNLKNATLRYLKSVEPDFSAAILKGAQFTYAEIKEAKFLSADLSGANFSNSNLENADFSGADLSEASMIDANVKNANFSNANLQAAKLFLVRELQVDQLKAANNYLLAFYDPELINELKLPFDHNARVEEKRFSRYDFNGSNLSSANLNGADVSGARFSNANLNKANFHNADMRDAVLHFANLEDADLTGITFTDHEQFSAVKTLYKAKMDIDLRSELKRRYPYLFVEPEPEDASYPTQRI
jgi:uncharacterized protein YjbI with pentapeptide repeats